jgi:membrane-associated phospholipid phosphatase
MALFSSCLFVGLLGKVAEAAAPTAGSPDPHFELKNTRWQALSVESLAAGTGLASAWFFTGGPRKTCHWCDSNTFDEGVRSTLKASEPRAPALVSHGLSVVAVPALTLTGLIVPAYRDERTHHGLEDSWIVLNTFLITTAIGDLTKHLVARERPTFHHHSERETEFSNLPSEHNKSFFSLDTAWAFAIASSGATLAHLRGYSSANYIAVGGGVLALGAGTLRIVGDAHWTTDVLTGAVVGTVIGIAVPTLLHGRRHTESVASTTLPLTPGPTVAISFIF